MSTRKVKDAIDLETNEKVYLKGHAKATFMSDGKSVEDAINDIQDSVGGSSSGNSVYPQVNHGTSDTTFILTPNTLHVWDEVAALDLTLGEAKEGIVNEYVFQFKSGIAGTTLTLPEELKWVEGETPNVLANRCYQVSVVNNFALSANFTPYIVNDISFDGNSGILYWWATYPLARKLYIYFSNIDRTYELNEGEIEGELDMNLGYLGYLYPYLSFTVDPEPYVTEINDGTFLYKIPESIKIEIYD